MGRGDRCRGLRRSVDGNEERGGAWCVDWWRLLRSWMWRGEEWWRKVRRGVERCEERCGEV